MRLQKNILFLLLLLTVFAACRSSKKLTLNEEIMARPGGASVWYTRADILSKGQKTLTLYSSPALLRAADSTPNATYALRFSQTSLLEMVRYNAGDTLMDAAVVRPQEVNAPYYFVNTNHRRTLGIWQPDAYRMYLVYRFVAYKNNGGYIVDLIQMQ